MPEAFQSRGADLAWTGGQYSLLRAIVAGFAAVVLACAYVEADGAAPFTASLVVAAMAVALGAGGRPMAAAFAILLPYALPDFLDTTAARLLYLWTTLHFFLPAAPYGSVAALAREDPDGGWWMPTWYGAVWRAVFVAALLVFGAQQWWSGSLYVAGPLVAAGLLGMFARTEPAAWMLSLAVQAFSVYQGDGSIGGLLLFHLLTLQPAWVARSPGREPSTVFYDGNCALCHGAVRFLVAEDREPARFRLAPLEGPTFAATVPESVRVHRPDSIVVTTGSDVLLRGDAVVAILDGLGGMWRLVGGLLRLLPRALVDRSYDAVAARRLRWFGRKQEACPLMTETQRGRIDP
ncbi:MAG: DCC1-like thiol-disulfide oxidoreductase family protein [Candidatus Binatia bacterium]